MGPLLNSFNWPALGARHSLLALVQEEACMPNVVPQLAIEDIADLPDPVSPFALSDGGELDISLMDVVIAIIDQP